MSRHLMAKMQRRTAVRTFDFGNDPHLPHEWEEVKLVSKGDRFTRNVPNVFEWHPPHGESHVTYWVMPPADPSSGFGYSLKHEGFYKGSGDEGPEYHLEDDGSPTAVKEHELDKAGTGTYHLGRHDTLEDAKAAAADHFDRNYASKARPGADYYDNALGQIDDPHDGYDIFGDKP